MRATRSEGSATSDGPMRRCPPRLVYRRLLAGGAATLQLSPRHGAVVLACGSLASLAAVGWISGSLQWSRLGVLAWTLGNTLTGLVLAAIAARWLGSRAGMLAALTHLSSLYSLMPDQQGPACSLASLAGCVAIGAFASAQVPGRFPCADRWTEFGMFCAAAAAAALVAGLAGPACILTICLGYLALFQDGPGLRFFAVGLRPVLFTIALAAALLVAGFVGVPDPQGLRFGALSPIFAVDGAGIAHGVLWAGMRLLPWWPWALLAIGAGLRQGHYAAPFGRLMIAWLLGPWTLWAAGLLPPRLAFAFFAPAVAITAAIGVSSCVSSVPTSK